LKPERWGSPLVQEKYQEERACDKRHPYRIIIIVIIIIINIITLHCFINNNNNNNNNIGSATSPLQT